MHIMEGFLPPSHCIAWGAASAPFLVHGAVKLRRVMREHPQARLTLAASGAFTFVLSALKMPSVTGSCSHPTGTGLGAVLFGPPVMSVIGAIVLLFQALLLAHGGITTLGANIFSIAIEKIFAPRVVMPPCASKSAWNSNTIAPITLMTGGPKSTAPRPV